MSIYLDKKQENARQTPSLQRQGDNLAVAHFVDNRPSAIAQRKLQEAANLSPQALQLKANQSLADNSTQQKQEAMAETPQIQAKNDVIQRDIFSFAGLKKAKKPEFVPKSDTTAFDKAKAKKIEQSMKDAYKMAVKAKSKIGKDNKHYKTYLDAGKTDVGKTDERVEYVTAGFDKIINCLKEDTITFKKYALDDGEEDTTYAYVHAGQNKREIFLGGAYWDAKAKGYDSKAGTVIHELTHELFGTKDHVYGRDDAKDLAKNKPHKATTNADNYEFFAEGA